MLLLWYAIEVLTINTYLRLYFDTYYSFDPFCKKKLYSHKAFDLYVKDQNNGFQDKNVTTRNRIRGCIWLRRWNNMYFTTTIFPVINRGCNYGLIWAKRSYSLFVHYEILLSSSYGFLWRNIPPRVRCSQFPIFLWLKESRFISWLTCLLTIERLGK